MVDEMMKPVVLFCLMVVALISTTTALKAQRRDTLKLVHVERKIMESVKKIHRIEFQFDGYGLADGSETLQNNVNSWIASQMSKLTGVKIASGSSGMEYIAANEFEKQYVLNSKKEIQAFLKANKKEADHPVYLVLEVKVVREYETAQIITFKIESYKNNYEVKSLQSEMYATFNKKTGKQLTWGDVVAKKAQPKLCALLAENTRKYFEVSSFTNLKNVLSIGQSCTQNNFPLPANSPGVTKSGIKAAYLPKEIHKEMALSVELNYSQIQGIMLPTMKSLLK